MTDRLATLMRDEVEALDIPAPRATEILDTGRRLRRRRAWTQRAGAVGLAAAVVTAGAFAVRGEGHSDKVAPATSPDTPQIAYAAGNTVYLGDGTTKATMPEFAQTLYYTSAGILVRTNKDGASDGGAPFHFELVREDGTTTKLGVTLGEVTPSVDASEPFLAWATMSGGKIQVVVHDVSTDRDVATVDVPGTFDWGGWEGPPVALSGDEVYVGTNGKAQVVNWRTGASAPSDAVPGSTFPDVHGGHAVVQGIDSTLVIDASTGKTLVDISAGSGGGFVQLSPDGQFAMVSAGIGPSKETTDIYDVATGSKVQVPHSGWGWTYDSDQVFRVQGSTLETCSTTTGECQSSSVPSVGKDEQVRYAGFAYES
jgi:hypothetical protein